MKTGPCSSREETIETLESLLDRSPKCNVYGDGPMVLSDIPIDAQKSAGTAQKPVIMGIDEAGRGPVLGPMVYGAAFWTVENDAEMCTRGFDDSKALSSSVRASIFEKIKQTPELGFAIRVLHASEISRNMLRATPYNLNAMSHDAAIAMIRAVIDAGVKIERVYIDTVGIASSYQAKLERIFDGEGIQFTVEKKADSKYKTCSAASIAAKVLRDEMIEKWNWSEKNFDPTANLGKGYGSGYPSDPKCKAWLEKSMTDPVFCFPDFVRFSWGPAKLAAKEKGKLVEWEADEEDDDDGSGYQQTSVNDYFSKGNDQERCRKKARLGIFEELGLSVANDFTSL